MREDLRLGLQPLDVGCFLPMRKVFEHQTEILMRNRINHITKPEFVSCFIAAFNASITKSNILGGFGGTGLVPPDPEVVITQLDVRLHTPTPPTVKDGHWQSQTPSNILELGRNR
jgi:hypothetical protein